MGKSQPRIGAHTSTAGGLQNALYEGREIGATTVQIFTRNQKQWKGAPLKKEEILLWQKALEETGIAEVMSHDSYLINLGSPKPEILEKSRTAFKEEIERCHQLGLSFLNFHPGAATESSVEACLDTIVESLLFAAPFAEKGTTRLLLETTAGQGTSVGYTFGHIASIVERVKHAVPIGVCIDTCHIFAAGYDIRTASAWAEMLDTFEREVGLKHLFAFHVNDSQKPLGSRVDRHALLGKGEIGEEAFRAMMQCPRTGSLPKYLETPGGPAGWKEEIALLRSWSV